MPRRPNIILTVADDIVYGDCSGFGSETIRMPHIDEIAGWEADVSTREKLT